MKAIILLASIILFGFIQSQTNQEKFSNGRKLFSRECTPCHSIEDKIIGPALKDIHLRRDSAWLYKWTTASQKLIKSGDTAAVALFNNNFKIVQPDFDLSPAEVDDIYYYIKSGHKH